MILKSCMSGEGCDALCHAQIFFFLDKIYLSHSALCIVNCIVINLLHNAINSNCRNSNVKTKIHFNSLGNSRNGALEKANFDSITLKDNAH